MKTSSPPLDELKRQLAQLDALIAEGVLTGAAGREARDRLEAQVLARVTDAAVAAAAPRPSRRLLAGVTAFVVLFSLVGYAWLGNLAGWQVAPGAAGETAAQEGAPTPAERAQIDAMVARLEERLKAQPSDAQGWSMLARSYTAQARYGDAVAAYKRVVELKPQDAQALADYADGMALANNRTLDGEPEKIIMQAVALDPANVKALTLAGTVAFNRNDFRGAAGYWERAVQASDPASEFTRQLQGALDEARQRAGTDVAAAAPDPAASGGGVAGRITLKASLQGQAAPDDTVFIFARATSGPKMPLAILRRKVRDLPLDYHLDDSQAMSPAARLSSVAQVVVGARISKSGNAMPAPGDLQGVSAPVAVGARGVLVEIGDVVR